MLAVAEQSELNSQIVPKIATGFCGGVSRTKGICGAVSGAVMALGMMLGRTKPEDSSEQIYEKVQQLISVFELHHGSSNCFELTGCDFRNPSDRLKWRDTGIRDKCLKFSQWCACSVADLIADKTPR
ncbi:MAG: C-GCAxxG-C-C family protein [Syntrophaceae bacterium]|nr:C-GCAxxG-C-C family protein [Syntrophaceae bacterium]